MAAYFIVDQDIIDPEGYRNYARQVPPTLEKYGGKILVAGVVSHATKGAQSRQQPPRRRHKHGSTRTASQLPWRSRA